MKVRSRGRDTGRGGGGEGFCHHYLEDGTKCSMGERDTIATERDRKSERKKWRERGKVKEEREKERQTDRQTHRQTHRQREMLTDRETDRVLLSPLPEERHMG